MDISPETFVPLIVNIGSIFYDVEENYDEDVDPLNTVLTKFCEQFPMLLQVTTSSIASDDGFAYLFINTNITSSFTEGTYISITCKNSNYEINYKMNRTT